ncbi:hypothetical protein BABINDRAFT_165874 [Babjeviella inositovora NRRL Y-12698]|uniref:Sld7 C-terminal domain-containing protein n=1 Tax=Babjeviella inositovora NRRL Y-12698 TaxID=984486 RepID=A0A1E3QVR6_9ASCO|nr:uncharacterized protein BABINDRAFT_165874 [Babjeviella inositovora NRRL Y-12698]ODQ81172.1 hypothetical protein BABINDRAFT_165874 [Babjeviella inositovora NRRL Y-12698]
MEHIASVSLSPKGIFFEKANTLLDESPEILPDLQLWAPPSHEKAVERFLKADNTLFHGVCLINRTLLPDSLRHTGQFCVLTDNATTQSFFKQYLEYIRLNSDIGILARQYGLSQHIVIHHDMEENQKLVMKMKILLDTTKEPKPEDIFDRVLLRKKSLPYQFPGQYPKSKLTVIEEPLDVVPEPPSGHSVDGDLDSLPVPSFTHNETRIKASQVSKTLQNVIYSELRLRGYSKPSSTSASTTDKAELLFFKEIYSITYKSAMFKLKTMNGWRDLQLLEAYKLEDIHDVVEKLMNVLG